MLKITVQRGETKSTLLLEGKLAGAWVAEVENSWVAERAKAKEVLVDLNEVTFVDAEGKALLTKLHEAGATLICKGCLTRAIVAQACGESSETPTQGKMNTQHKIIKAILIGFFAIAIQNSGTARAQEKSAIQLTLHDAVALALKQNPQVQIGVLQSAQAKQDQNIARADLLPQAQFNVSDAVERANLETAFGSRFPGFAEHLGPFQIFNVGPSASAPIVDFAAWSRLHAAKENTSAAHAGEQSIREDMVLQTVSQYLGALRAAAQVKAAQTRIDLAQALYNQAADMQKNGAGTGIDTLRANVELQNEKQVLIAAQTQFDVALFGLARLLSLDPRQPIQLSDAMSFFETPEFAIEGSIDRAYQVRPEMLQIDARLRAAQENRHAAFNERLPSIRGEGGWNYQGVSINSGIPVYEYQVGAVVPLFTGGRIQAETSKADLEIKKVEQQRDDLRNEIALEVKTATAQLESARHQVEVANLGIQLAQEEVTQARDRFAAGVADNIEVVQAQDALSRASDNQIAALYQFNQARADLARAIGQMESLYTK
ncbi:MAG TPA: TolC family protein [Candidatus Acidoferrales bacterium]|jgi:outer membrane protein